MGSPRLQEWKTLASSPIQLAGKELFHSVIACYDLAAANPKHPPTHRIVEWNSGEQRLASKFPVAAGPSGCRISRPAAQHKWRHRRKLVARRSLATDPAAIRGRATAHGAHKESMRGVLVCGVPGWVLSLFLSICRSAAERHGTERGQATREGIGVVWHPRIARCPLKTRVDGGPWILNLLLGPVVQFNAGFAVKPRDWSHGALVLRDSLPQRIHDYMDMLPETIELTPACASKM